MTSLGSVVEQGAAVHAGQRQALLDAQQDIRRVPRLFIAARLANTVLGRLQRGVEYCGVEWP